MFTGSVPREVVTQLFRLVPLGAWRDVYIGCSGAFRVDAAVKLAEPDVRVFGNDVSLLSCAIGHHLAGGALEVRFTGELAFVEDLLAGVTENSARCRVAAVMVAAEMGQHRGKSRYAQAHVAHYREHFPAFVVKAEERLEALAAACKLDGFYPGDFRNQIARARDSGGGFLCFAPTYKGGYERIYAWLDAHTAWQRPEYRLWDPKDLPGLLDELDRDRVRYAVISDTAFPGREPRSEFRGANKPVYLYADVRSASYRARAARAKPFRYRPLDASALRPNSVVEIREAPSDALNFAKNVYLAKGIKHKAGMANFLVFVDGMLAGGFIYTLQEHVDRATALYLLSDFATTRERRVSKLIPMLATCREVVSVLARRYIMRVVYVTTTAFTDKPVSMKYRGIFELHARKAGMLQYRANVREARAQEVYGEWFQRFAARGAADERGARAAA